MNVVGEWCWSRSVADESGAAANSNSDDNSDFCPLLTPAWHVSALRFFSFTAESLHLVTYMMMLPPNQSVNQTIRPKIWSFGVVWCHPSRELKTCGCNILQREFQLTPIKMSNWTCVCLLLQDIIIVHLTSPENHRSCRRNVIELEEKEI